MAGSAGVGKSTLTERLGATLRQRHTPVDAFGEEQLFTRSQFAAVADGFRTRQYASPEQFEVAYRTWLDTLTAETVAITDWNPSGMTGDLPWATSDRNRFRQHLQAVRTLAHARVLLLHLQAPAEISIERAARERGEGWLSRSDQIAQSTGHHQAKRFDRLVAETVRHAAQTRTELRVAAEAGWPIRTIDAVGDSQEVHHRAITVIDTILSAA
jgi:thymidylate kinase